MRISKRRVLLGLLCVSLLPQLGILVARHLMSASHTVAQQLFIRELISKQPSLTAIRPAAAHHVRPHEHLQAASSSVASDPALNRTTADDATRTIVYQSVVPQSVLNFTDKFASLPDAPEWQKRLKERVLNRPKRFYLAEVLQVRIYSKDLAKWTLAELKQWMHYMFWSGVEHIYLCDHYATEDERLDAPLRLYIELGLVTYIPKHLPRTAMDAQVDCYQNIINTYQNVTTWQIAVDMDEYPFAIGDTKEGFLKRFLEKQPEDVSEVSMHNYLMLGQGDRTKNITIERIDRITPDPPNELDKPIYRPQNVYAQLHHNILLRGRTLEVNGDSLRMLHYWGSRLQDWGEDTKKVLDMTVKYTAMRDSMAPAVRHSLNTFGETDVFSVSTGP